MAEISRPYGKMRIVGGTHPEFVDFKCGGCGLVTEDVYFKSKVDVTETVTCSGCGNKAHKVILRTNFIHPSHSSMYGRKEPALGNEVIQDYAHKKRLMKEYDIIESNDPTGGNRKYSEELKHEAYLNDKRREGLPKTTWVGAPDEVK